jgi:hypothetical protein
VSADDESPPIQQLGTSQTVEVPSAYARISPLGVHMQARTYQRAGDHVRIDGGQPDAVAFLYCRAIELAIKAYLVARGESVDRMTKFGHDLTILLVETDARGLDRILLLTAPEKDLIRRAGVLYEDNKLGYFDLMHTVTGPRLPLEELAAVAKRLIDALEKPIWKATDTPTWKPEGM